MENGIASSARLGGRIGDKGGRLSSRAAEQQSNNRQGAGRQLLQISKAAQAQTVWEKEGMEGRGDERRGEKRRVKFTDQSIQRTRGEIWRYWVAEKAI